MKICAMVDRSAGNESVGEMWTETALFDEGATIADVLKWAQIITMVDYGLGTGLERWKDVNTRCNVRLAVLQEPKG